MHPVFVSRQNNVNALTLKNMSYQGLSLGDFIALRKRGRRLMPEPVGQ